MPPAPRRPEEPKPTIDEQRVRAARQAMFNAMLKEALDG